MTETVILQKLSKIKIKTENTKNVLIIKNKTKSEKYFVELNKKLYRHLKNN